MGLRELAARDARKRGFKEPRKRVQPKPLKDRSVCRCGSRVQGSKIAGPMCSRQGCPVKECKK